MTIQFGQLPVRSVFVLSSDGDFYQQVITDDSTNYPGTATMTLKLYDADDVVLDTWTASISTNLATFNEDAATVATVLADSPVQGRVFYNDGAGGPTLLLASGTITEKSP